MIVEITPQSIITAGAVVSALTAIVVLVFRFVRWCDRQKAQDSELKELKAHHNSDISHIMKEQKILMQGILACLKGLKEQGCNGPVTEAIKTIEDHLNQRAHEQ